jgi:hypothetical protein
VIASSRGALAPCVVHGRLVCLVRLVYLVERN